MRRTEFRALGGSRVYKRCHLGQANRKSRLKNVLFPVECRSIYLASDSDESGDDESRPSLPTTYRRIRRFRAVVDIQRDRVFAVVAEDYRLVTNAEALDLGKSCFGKVFSQPTARSMKVFNVTTPSTRSFCHVDFIHEQGGFEPWQGDKWVYPGFPTPFWGLSGFCVGDSMGKSLWKLVENTQRFPRRGVRVLCVHGAVSFHRARPCATR